MKKLYTIFVLIIIGLIGIFFFQSPVLEVKRGQCFGDCELTIKIYSSGFILYKRPDLTDWRFRKVPQATLEKLMDLSKKLFLSPEAMCPWIGGKMEKCSALPPDLSDEGPRVSIYMKTGDKINVKHYNSSRSQEDPDYKEFTKMLFEVFKK